MGELAYSAAQRPLLRWFRQAGSPARGARRNPRHKEQTTMNTNLDQAPDPAATVIKVKRVFTAALLVSGVMAICAALVPLIAGHHSLAADIAQPIQSAGAGILLLNGVY